MSTLVDITDLDPAAVLVALHAAAAPRGMGFFHLTQAPLGLDEARALLAEFGPAPQLYFDYLGGRCLKTEFLARDGRVLVDVRLFDREYGEGAGRQTVERVRSPEEGGRVKFVPAPRTLAFDVLRFVSEGGTWELGLRRVMFGVRVVANPVGHEEYCVDSCCGASPVHATVVLQAVQAILARYPEGTPARTIDAILPGWERRPIQEDPCLERLLALACGPRLDPT